MVFLRVPLFRFVFVPWMFKVAWLAPGLERRVAAGAYEAHSADFRIASQLANVINERKPISKYA